MRPTLALLSLLTAPAAAQAPADTLPLRVAEKQIDAFNRKDLDGMMALFAPDATMAEFPAGRVFAADRNAIRARFATMMAAGTIPKVSVDPRVVDGPFVFERETWPANPGERSQSIWMYEIRGGLIRRAWTVRM